MKRWGAKLGGGRGAILAAVVLMAAGGGLAAVTAQRYSPEPPAATSADAEAEEESSPSGPLSEEDEALAKRLYELLKARDLPAAAQWMADNSGRFSSIYYESLGAEPWLFDGERWKKGAEGRGMVFCRASLVFVGGFLDGKPQGDNLAFQALNMNGLRCDYAVGWWNKGKLNGLSRSGYTIYEDGRAAASAEKWGAYEDNLLNGEFIYTVSTADGGELVWNLEADEGVTVLNDDWKYDEGQDTYVLLAAGRKDLGYRLPAAEAGAVRWRNQLEWGQ